MTGQTYAVGMVGRLSDAAAAALVLRDAAAEQRRLSADSRTNNGQAEHEDFADWLEERADRLVGELGGGEQDEAQLGLVSRDGQQGLGTCSPEPPLLDREALRAAVIRVVDDSLEKGALSPDWIVDAVVELARPMPTQEQLAEAAVRGIRFNLPVDAFGQSKRLDEYFLIWGNAAAINVLALLSKGAGS